MGASGAAHGVEVGVNAAVAAGGGSNEQSPVSEATAAGEPIVISTPAASIASGETTAATIASPTESDGETTAVADGIIVAFDLFLGVGGGEARSYSPFHVN